MSIAELVFTCAPAHMLAVAKVADVVQAYGCKFVCASIACAML
jgi:hypothetical protein